MKTLENDTSISAIKEQIAIIAKLIHQARKHVRGSKTADSLKEASDTMKSLLNKLEIDQTLIYNRSTYEARSVCPEQYFGTSYGAPFYYRGFEIKPCNHSTPISELVTIVKLFKFEANDTKKNKYITEINTFLSSVHRLNSNIRVVVAINLSLKDESLAKYPGTTLVHLKHDSDGEIMNDLVREVKTPYVQIARNTEVLTEDIRFERLIREIEQLNVTVVGGAFRNQNGHWKKGCFQAVYRNFTLRYLEGYDESFHECLFCDYIEGPFITSKGYINENQFFKLNESNGLFEEWFLRISLKNHETIVCPDSMFNVKSDNNSNQNWNKFMEKWDLYKCITPLGYTIVKHCFEYNEEFIATKAVPPCNLQYNANAVKILMKMCEIKGIFCELQEGTALGAVKLGKTLPWERDIDLTFLTANYTAILKLKNILRKERFGMSAFDERWCCVDNETAGGRIVMRYFGWYIELYGQHIIDSKILTDNGIKPTKVLLDGQWVNVPRNPGLFVRNRYGREIYKHAEHWIATGERNGWINYKTNGFRKCFNSGDHDCLDRYNADGDLLFTYMLP
jgi:hypothetical protein